MCGRYGRASRFERIAQMMSFTVQNAAGELEPRYNVAPTTKQPVVRADAVSAIFELRNWGLVPFWSREPAKGVRPINARCETAAEKPMFRKLIRDRRCLVPVDWFYEWKATPAGKVPHLIQMASREPFFFGGLWDTWHEGSEDAIPSFTILTCAPNELMQTIHDRMPVIVAPQDAARWLDPGQKDISDLLRPFPAEEMTARPVSTRVNSVRNEGPELIESI